LFMRRFLAERKVEVNLIDEQIPCPHGVSGVEIAMRDGIQPMGKTSVIIPEGNRGAVTT